MRRLIVLSLAVLMFAGVAFAQVADGLSIGVDATVAFVPLEYEFWKNSPVPSKSDRLNTAMGTPWMSGFGRTARLKFEGDWDYAGFKLWISTDNSQFDQTLMFSDFAGMWVKPHDMIRLDFGKFQNDTLMGKVGDTDFHSFVMNMGDGNVIFTRFEDRNGPGFLLSLTPVEGVFVGVGLPTIVSKVNAAWERFGDWNNQTQDTDHGRDVWRLIQIGAGYEIEGTGHIRLQYVGKPHVNDADYQAIETSMYTNVSMGNWHGVKDDIGDIYDLFKRMELAFAFTGVEDMTVDFGFKYRLPAKYHDNKGVDGVKVTPPVSLALGVEYTLMENIGIHFLTEASFAGNVKAGSRRLMRNPIVWNFHLVPSYKLDFATVGLELGGEFTKLDKDILGNSLLDIGIGAWIKRDLGENAYIKGGLTYTKIDKDWNGKDNPRPLAYVRVPIVVDFSF